MCNERNNNFKFIQNMELLKYINIIETINSLSKCFCFVFLFISVFLILNYMFELINIETLDGSKINILSYFYQHLYFLKSYHISEIFFKIFFNLVVSYIITSIIILIEFQEGININNTKSNLLKNLSKINIAPFINNKRDIINRFIKIFSALMFISFFEIFYIGIIYTTIFIFLFYLVIYMMFNFFLGVNLIFKDAWISLAITVITYIINKKFEDKKNLDIQIMREITDNLNKLPYKIIIGLKYGKNYKSAFNRFCNMYKEHYNQLIYKSFNIRGIHKKLIYYYNRDVIRSYFRGIIEYDIYKEILKNLWNEDEEFKNSFIEKYNSELENILTESSDKYSFISKDVNFYLDFVYFMNRRSLILDKVKEYLQKKDVELNFGEFLYKKNIEFTFNQLLYFKIDGFYFKDVLDMFLNK